MGAYGRNSKGIHWHDACESVVPVGDLEGHYSKNDDARADVNTRVSFKEHQATKGDPLKTVCVMKVNEHYVAFSHIIYNLAYILTDVFGYQLMRHVVEVHMHCKINMLNHLKCFSLHLQSFLFLTSFA